MLTVVGIMLVGIGLGYLFRGKKLSFIPKVTMVSIYLLLFFLGVSVGSNPEIMDNLDTIGLDGLIITLAALAGSLLAGWFVYFKFFKDFR
ncbi:MAG: LysO family transporter [Rikenellaceae bacterium]